MSELKLKFEIPFDKEIFIRQNMRFFDFSNLKVVQTQKTNLIFGLIYLSIGIFFLTLEDTFFIDTFLTILGGLILMYYFRVRLNLKNKKDDYKNFIEKLAQKHIDNQSISVWEFWDSHIFYQDFRSEIKIYWQHLYGIRVDDQSLYIDLEEPIRNQSFCIDKDEISEKQFEEVIDFLQTKLTRS